jgi:hypothetical protein
MVEGRIDWNVTRIFGASVVIRAQVLQYQNTHESASSIATGILEVDMKVTLDIHH